MEGETLQCFQKSTFLNMKLLKTAQKFKSFNHFYPFIPFTIISEQNCFLQKSKYFLLCDKFNIQYGEEGKIYLNDYPVYFIKLPDNADVSLSGLIFDL